MEQEHELHHVFINHRGPDVKNSLASLIYHRLQNVHGMCVFLDKNEIHTGDNISDAIRTAIQNAYVHITIFSLRYAESSWCLEELCSILSSYHKHNRTVIPVFYDVEPTDLRHIERGCYKIAFEEHQRKGRVSKEVMKNWKEALIKASHLSGLLFKTKESDQGEMLEKIVGIVLKEVRKWGSLDVAKYPVGLKQAADDLPINEILKQNESSDTMIVGIAGMSGAGKSTLAKYLYNMRRLYFNGRSCFLSNVRQEDLLSLQRKLFRDLLGYNLDLQYIGSIAEGRRMLQHYRFLLVLDDVDHIRQIDGLIDIDSVGRGSLILITSRDKGLLTSTSPKTLVYEVKPLNRQQGQELFCQHAFHKSRPSEGFEDLVEKFVEICQGLPLSLEVLGGHFLGENDRKSWERQLSCFSTTLHQDIESVLRVSYDALNSEEKEAFLDIGCFLVGEETELAIRVLNGLYDSDIEHCLETLHQKCFLEFHYDVLSDDEFEYRKREKPVMGYNDLSVQYQGYKLTMHDQLRQLALKIGGTLTPFRIVTDDPGLRETRYKMVLNKLEAQYKYNISPPNELLPIRGIRRIRLLEETLIKRETSYQMRVGGLRLVVMEGDRFNRWKISDRFNRWKISEGDRVNTWEISGDLVWLRLRNVRFTTNMFSSISLRLLRVLELQCPGDSIEQFFKRFMDHFTQEPDQSPSPLSELNINALDDALPSTSSSSSTVDPPHLKFSSAVQQGGHGPQPYLFQFLARIGLGMVNLCKMVLTNLTFLQSLPIDFENIGSLRHLDLSGCTSLTELPRSFSKLLQLQYLALRDCRNLSIPVDILGNISTLKYANFKGCAQLVTLPQGIPYQMDLRYLNLLFTSLSQLPDDLEQLGNLEELRIGSPELMGLPLSMAKLGRLSQLNVIQCRHLQCLLPEAIAGPNIKILAIDDCPIASFPFQKDERTIGVLRDLILKKTSISEINMVEGVLRGLETIDLSENIQLKQVVALSSGLVRVNLQNCRELKTLKNISNLVKLKFLNINECLELETLSVEGLISLEEIEADTCCKLKRIEGLSQLKGLKSLNINGCLELETLSVEGLISLEEIEANKCWKLKRIEGLSRLKRLKSLKISTDNGIFREDICNFLISPSSDALSTFICTGKVDEMDVRETQRKMALRQLSFYPNVKKLKIVSTRTSTDRFELEIENLSSQGAILLWFISNAVGRRSFHVNIHGREYKTHRGEGGGRRLHIFMWTQYSKLFKELISYGGRIYVGCSCDASASEVEEICAEGGWLLMVEKHRNVSEIRKEIFRQFALTDGTGRT